MTITTDATTGEPDVANYRNKVRPNARGGSWDAAKLQTNGKTGALQVTIYELLRDCGPMTDDALRKELTARYIKHSRSGVSARRVELERAGWVRPIAEKRPSDLGVMSLVFEAVPEGHEHESSTPLVKRRTAAERRGAERALAVLDALFETGYGEEPYNQYEVTLQGGWYAGINSARHAIGDEFGIKIATLEKPAL